MSSEDPTAEQHRRRNRDFLALATERGWNVPAQAGSTPLSEIWIYSVTATGRVRAMAQLLASLLAKLRKPRPMRDKHVRHAAAAVERLDRNPCDPDVRASAMNVLAAYFSRTRHWRSIAAKPPATGIHLVVVDWKTSEIPSGRFLRPMICLQPGPLTVPILREAARTVIDYERIHHPERLPDSLRDPPAR